MIKTIFNYITDIANELDSDLLLLDDPYGDDDLASTNEIEDGFRIIPGPTSTTKLANSIQRIFPISIELTLKAHRNIIEDYHELFDKALALEGEILSPLRVNNEPFSTVETSGVTPLTFDSNDRVIRFRININFVAFYDCD